MKFICNAQKLSTACSNVQRAVSQKTAIPAIEGILIRAGEGKVVLTGYNLEVGIITKLEAQVENSGSIVLNARILCDILKSFITDDVLLEADERLTCRIRCGEAEFTLSGISPSEYPELPAVNGGTPIIIGGELLRDMIRKTIFAAAESDSNVVHTGVRFEIAEKSLRLVAVDGFRLAIRSERIDYAGEEKVFVVPKKTLNEVMKLAEGKESVSLNIGRRHIVFRIGGYDIVSRLLDGEFLNYKAAISGSAGATVRADVRQLIESIERTSLLITDRVRSPIRCVFDRDSIRLSCVTSLGTASDKVPVRMKGEKLEIGFNNRFLLDSLRVCDTEEIIIQLSSPVLPIIMVPPEGDSFLFLILPVRLKTQ